MRTLISNGTVVTADGSTHADVLVDGETIAQIGRDLAAAGVTADETIDATGKYVIPGGIDVHTHMELPFGGTFAKDTFETGTRAAAFGGTTMIVDFAVQSKGQALRTGLDACKTVIDRVFDRLVIAGLEMKEGVALDAAPIAAEQRIVAAQVQRAADHLVAAQGHHQDDTVGHAFADAIEKIARQVR